MRIDYFVAAEQLKDRIVSCEMHGQGIELQGITYSISNITSAGCVFSCITWNWHINIGFW